MNNKNRKILELYIHIPFCISKCKYCDFLSAPAQEETKVAYMQALCREIAERGKEYQDYVLNTVFIGGGTPTVVPAMWIKQVMEVVRQHYHLLKEAEVTMELNPATVDLEALQVYKAAGINRLSIGLQSANNEELKQLGRIHSYEQFVETYMQARLAGFANINVDIMSALPGQTLTSYRRTLERVTGLEPPPEHISAYSLIVEEGTPFYEAMETGMLNLPDEEIERSMYELTGKFLQEFGYGRYEISNYAKPGWECKHNLGYWERVNYLGVGIGAASLIENARFSNGRNLQGYLLQPAGVLENYQKLGISEQMEETMFLGLRKTKGVSVSDFEDYFGISFWQVYGEVTQKHIEDGLLEQRLDEKGKKYIALTQKGMDVSNYVMADFLEPSLFS